MAYYLGIQYSVDIKAIYRIVLLHKYQVIPHMGIYISIGLRARQDIPC